jgi:hypothetical protein
LTLAATYVWQGVHISCINTPDFENDVDVHWSGPWELSFTRGMVHWHLTGRPEPVYIEGEPFVKEVWAGFELPPEESEAAEEAEEALECEAEESDEGGENLD